MTARDWKPGDVAMATFDHGGTGMVFRVIGAPSDWCDMAGVCAPAGQIKSVRPLVVIDPEDAPSDPRKFLESLSRLWGQAPDDFRMHGGTNLLNWLASHFEPPTPPKPEEPAGLGAVVEDAEGEKWLRWEIEGRHPKPWTVAGAVKPNRAYADITAVRVLSEGVTA